MQQRWKRRLLCCRRLALLCLCVHLPFRQCRPSSHHPGLALLLTLAWRTSLEAEGLKPLGEQISFQQTNLLGLTLWNKASKEGTQCPRGAFMSPRGLKGSLRPVDHPNQLARGKAAEEGPPGAHGPESRDANFNGKPLRH